MNTSTATQALAGRSGRDGFFAHHGVWAPTVRLFRHLSFGPKMLVILAMLVVPLSVLLSELVVSARAQLVATAHERAGAQFLQAFAPLTRHLIETRNATRAIIGGFAGSSAYQQARERSDKAFSQFDALLQSYGDPLDLRADYDKLKST